MEDLTVAEQRPRSRPGATAEELRVQIRALVSEYARLTSDPKPFIPGRSLVPYAGRVYDETEMCTLVDASLDFWLTAGPYASRLERGLADFVGVDKALLVNSGSSANLVALSALTSRRLGDRRIGQGDEVITVAAGFPTTVAPILQAGAVPVFIDVDERTVNLNPACLEEALSSRTKAVMVAHTLGNPFDVDAVRAFCRRQELWLVEDNCDALGSRYHHAPPDGRSREWRLTGSFGDLSTSSFYPAHHMTTGEGGAVYTSDPQLAVVAESFRDWGRDCYCPSGKSNTCGSRFCQQLGTLPAGYDHKYVYAELGYNLKMTDLQAAVGLAQLQKLTGFAAARRRNHAILSQALAPYADRIAVQTATEHADPSWFGLLMRVRPGSGLSRDGLVAALEAAKVQTRMPFAGNLVRQPCIAEQLEAGSDYRVVGDLRVTDRIARDAFWIGVYPGLTDTQLAYVSETLVRVMEEASVRRSRQ